MYRQLNIVMNLLFLQLQLKDHLYCVEHVERLLQHRQYISVLNQVLQVLVRLHQVWVPVLHETKCYVFFFLCFTKMLTISPTLMGLSRTAFKSIMVFNFRSPIIHHVAYFDRFKVSFFLLCLQYSFTCLSPMKVRWAPITRNACIKICSPLYMFEEFFRLRWLHKCWTYLALLICLIREIHSCSFHLAKIVVLDRTFVFRNYDIYRGFWYGNALINMPHFARCFG